MKKLVLVLLTLWFTSGVPVQAYGQIGPVFIPVNLDIRPGSASNPINTRSRGLIPVAILDSETVDVEDIDVEIISFGRGEARAAHDSLGHLEDLNDDGLLDLVFHFRTSDTATEPGDTAACIGGELLDGPLILGCDDIVTLPS